MARARSVAGKADDLAEARWQIEQLQRKVGQQQLDLDFFRQALRRFAAPAPTNGGLGATVSSPGSKR
jgi:hypothetical protein